MGKEHALQNEIRNALAVDGVMMFRANVGQAWTGDVSRLPDGSILIRNPRPFSTGLPPGFGDLFGQQREVITADMVGGTFGRFFMADVKSATGRVGPHQAACLEAVRRNGGRSGIWRSVSDALATLGRKG